MTGDVYLIRNATGHFLGALSAEPGTGADRVAGMMASVEEITVELVRGQTLIVIPNSAVDDAKAFLKQAGYGSPE